MPNNEVQVFLLDFGLTMSVPEVSLFSLPAAVVEKRIYTQCIVLRDVEPLFPENFNGDPLIIQVR